jgi:hypothetical protein
MCARRADLIAIGGADEHIDYVGHICGPYEMTFRLVNSGLREIWHQTEFMYHTWHPGQAGEDNYLGPHDGRHVSTTALDALISARTMPLEENETIRDYRLANDSKRGFKTFQISPARSIAWQKDNIRRGRDWITGNTSRKMHGFVVDRTVDGYVAYPRFLEHPDFSQFQEKLEIHAGTELELQERLENSIPFRLRLAFPAVAMLTIISRAFGLTLLYLQRRLVRLTQGAKA